MKYAPEMDEDDPKALFQQQVPKSFVTLKERCQEYVKRCQNRIDTDVKPQLQNGVEDTGGETRDPVMSEDEFRYEVYSAIGQVSQK